MSVSIQEYNYLYGNNNILQEKQALQAELAGKSGAAPKPVQVEEVVGKPTEDKIEIRSQKQDREKLRELTAQAATDVNREQRVNASAFRAMTAMLFKDQAIDTISPVKSLASVNNIKSTTATSETRDPWGAEAVSEKILNFAKSLANGDDSKMDVLREAMEKGFDAAEQAWGGKLPEVSYDTRKQVQQGFDNWKNPTLEGK